MNDEELGYFRVLCLVGADTDTIGSCESRCARAAGTSGMDTDRVMGNHPTPTDIIARVNPVPHGVVSL